MPQITSILHCLWKIVNRSINRDISYLVYQYNVNNTIEVVTEYCL